MHALQRKLCASSELKATSTWILGRHGETNIKEKPCKRNQRYRRKERGMMFDCASQLEDHQEMDTGEEL